MKDYPNKHARAAFTEKLGNWLAMKAREHRGWMGRAQKVSLFHHSKSHTHSEPPSATMKLANLLFVLLAFVAVGAEKVRILQCDPALILSC